MTRCLGIINEISTFLQMKIESWELKTNRIRQRDLRICLSTVDVICQTKNT